MDITTLNELMNWARIYRGHPESFIKERKYLLPVEYHNDELALLYRADDTLRAIYDFANDETFEHVRSFSRLNLMDFAHRYGIPYRTVQNWAAGSSIHGYLLRLIFLDLLAPNCQNVKKRKNVKITIKDNWKETILTTDSDNFEKDLAENKDKLDLWWCCWVEYYDAQSPTYHEFNPNPDHRSPKQVIQVNGRWIYARYNFSLEGKENCYSSLLNYLNQDFRTADQVDELK